MREGVWVSLYGKGKEKGKNDGCAPLSRLDKYEEEM